MLKAELDFLIDVYRYFGGTGIWGKMHACWKPAPASRVETGARVPPIHTSPPNHTCRVRGYGRSGGLLHQSKPQHKW